MAVRAAKELRDGDVVFVGIGLPNLACNLARATHAPNLVLIYESGTLGSRPDLSVDGTITLENLQDVLYVGRPIHGQSDSTISLFKITPDGSEASRVNVKLGRSSVTTIEVVSGLQVGDKVILSDMSQWDNVDRIKLK